MTICRCTTVTPVLPLAPHQVLNNNLASIAAASGGYLTTSQFSDAIAPVFWIGVAGGAIYLLGALCAEHIPLGAGKPIESPLPVVVTTEAVAATATVKLADDVVAKQVEPSTQAAGSESQGDIAVPAGAVVKASTPAADEPAGIIAA